MKKNQHGFGIVEVIIIVIVLAILAGLGFVVYSNLNKSETPINPTSEQSSSSGDASKSDGTVSTANWTEYTNNEAKFSFSYPNTWVSADTSGCSGGVLFLGTDTNVTGKCGSEFFGQVSITWQPERAPCGLDGELWIVNMEEEITISGVKGRHTIATANESNSFKQAGSKTDQYCFTNNDLTYIFNNDRSVGGDVTAEYQAIVTKTLHFL